MPHILIIDDEPSTAWALAEGLSDDGYSIDTFRSAEDALVWLRSGQSDLVITDLSLPGLSGLDLARKLRGRSSQPVIVVTAYGAALPAEELEKVGVVGWFQKPFRLDPLRLAVREALSAAAPRRRMRKAA